MLPDHASLYVVESSQSAKTTWAGVNNDNFLYVWYANLTRLSSTSNNDSS
jgi:hypothetical protein